MAVTLRKVIAIKNVGRFLNCSASGDVELKRYNLVFAENGRGKTTLCAILRSLQSGEPGHVVGRTTLGAGGAPEVHLRTDSGNATFSAGAWNATLPTLAIFDATFVAENVYSGDVIDLGHRRNLYRVIIGKDGVDLARQVDDLDAAIRDKTSEIKDRRAAVQTHAPAGVRLEAFLPLSADPEIDAKIVAKERELDALRQADQVRTRALLTPLTLPGLPDGLEAALAASVEGIAADAGERVAAHIAAHDMQDRGEPWLAEGLGYVRGGDDCPFCGQSLAAAPLLEAYKAHFSAAYHGLRQRIADLRIAVETNLSDRAVAQVEKTLDTNDAAADFWSRYCEIVRPTLPAAAGTGETLRALRRAALDLLGNKSAAPLERISTDQPYYVDAVRGVTGLKRAVAAYNEAVQAANIVIAAKKAATGTTDIKTVEKALAQLQAVRARHLTDAAAACAAHDTALREKKDLEDRKAAAKTKLDDHTKQVIAVYERTINGLLDDFQAGFRITGTTHGYPGGVPTSDFQVLINDVPVELGDDKTPLDRPSFRNTLSSGDKSTLALAFFLAQLEHDPDKADRIVVFDDPFNSQDAFRKDHTVARIKKCGEGCTQVLVLSHDDGFLKRIWDRLAPADRKALQMARLGLRNTTIAEWDIEKATQDRFKADLKALSDFYNDAVGNPRDVVNKIRPVLETFCRTLYPSQFPDSDMLGGIVGKIRTAGAGHPLSSIVDDLDDLNIYTRRYHHGENPQAAIEAISDTELHGFVKKTMAITGCCSP